MVIKDVLNKLEITKVNPCSSTGVLYDYSDNEKVIKSPINNEVIASVCMANEGHYEKVMQEADNASKIWRTIPSPKRGEIVRQIGDELRKNKEALGTLVSLEMGKLLQEGLGEVQEMIDICDFAVGLSRQLHGLTMHSERPEHRMYEQWHPLGVVGIISAFNFPVAVWAWNAMIAAVCGNVCVWKPSEKTPLTAVACQNIVKHVLRNNKLPEGIFSLINGDASIGALLTNDKRVSLVSATGSTRMGRIVGKAVADRFGKTILELGGNNAVIISNKADLDLAIRAVAFGAVGTCGQRCTTTRRLIVHEDVYLEVKSRLVEVYKNIRIGNPLVGDTLVGPLIDDDAVNSFKDAIFKVEHEGGVLIVGGRHLYGNYVYPAIIEAENHYEMVQEETFAPILYLIKYKGDITNAIKIQNDVKQGLSSSLFTTDIRESEIFLSAWGSDCGIANINIGTSGAEIGGAFGGEKETGGGRESGSDSWKAYMRRQTNTINYSKELPLSQGIKFDI